MTPKQLLDKNTAKQAIEYADVNGKMTTFAHRLSTRINQINLLPVVSSRVEDLHRETALEMEELANHINLHVQNLRNLTSEKSELIEKVSFSIRTLSPTSAEVLESRRSYEETIKTADTAKTSLEQMKTAVQSWRRHSPSLPPAINAFTSAVDNFCQFCDEDKQVWQKALTLLPKR